VKHALQELPGDTRSCVVLAVFVCFFNGTSYIQLNGRTVKNDELETVMSWSILRCNTRTLLKGLRKKKKTIPESS
jgi:hypothetical protein